MYTFKGFSMKYFSNFSMYNACKSRKPGWSNRVFMNNFNSLVFAYKNVEINSLPYDLPYLWIINFGPYDLKLENEYRTGWVYGRSYEDLIEFFRDLSDVLHKNNNLNIVIYSEDLNKLMYTIQHLYTFKSDDVFVSNTSSGSSYLYIKLFDCIYIRDLKTFTNMSTIQFINTMLPDVIIPFKPDTFDDLYSYSMIEYTVQLEYYYNLSEYILEALYTEIKYIQIVYNDVQVMFHQSKKSDEHFKPVAWNIASLPHTQAGITRDFMRQAVKFKNTKDSITNLSPDEDIYRLLNQAFRGGDCCAAYDKIGIKYNDVYSYDRASSYPSVMLYHKFPMGVFKKSNIKNEDDLNKHIDKYGEAVLFRCHFKDIRTNSYTFGFPYIYIKNKKYCKNKNIILSDDAIVRSGRLVSASDLEITLTDVDFKAICKEYTYSNIEIKSAYTTNYGDLPYNIKRLIIFLFTEKTCWKNTYKDYNLSESERSSRRVFYELSKILLNSVAGIFEQDPNRSNVIFDNNNIVDAPGSDIYNKPTRVLSCAYQIGVWITAWGRYELHRVIVYACNHGVKVLYDDTDSIKTVGKIDLSWYNIEMSRNAKQLGCSIPGIKEYVRSFIGDKNSVYEPVYTNYNPGVFVVDHTYKEFITLGPKRYADISPNNTLELTCSGMNSKLGADELKRAGGLDVLLDEYTFSDSCGSEMTVNDPNSNTFVDENNHTHNIYPCRCYRPHSITLRGPGGVNNHKFDVPDIINGIDGGLDL